MNGTEHLILINSPAPTATVRATRDRRMFLLPCCFVVGLLLLSVSAAARSDEPANTEVRDMQPSVREAGVEPVLLINEGDPTRPLINDLVRTLQRRSARAGKRRSVVVERIHSSDAQITHQLDHATYREFPVVMMHGLNACKYAEKCFARELFSPGTQFLLLQRFGHEFRSDNDEFRALITEIDTGTIYPLETLQAGLQAFPDRTSLILIAGKLGVSAQKSVDLEKTAAQFAEQHKLSFYSASHEELQQIAVAGSQSDCSLKLDDILAVPLGRPLVLYWSVWLDGELTCDPREFMDYLAATCNKEPRRDSIPILGLGDHFIAPELACLGVCSDDETTADNVLAAIDGAVTEGRRNMVLFCEPNAVLERGGDIPEAAAAGSNSSPGIRIKYVIPPRLKEFANRAERLAAAEQKASQHLFNASIVILCLISSLAGLVYQSLRRRKLEVELHRRQRALEEAARMATLGTFCAAITHELSQPLAAIMNNADAALKLGTAGLDVSGILEIIADITKDNVRACNVLGRIASFARSGVLQTGRVNLNRICSDTAELASQRCRSAGITLDYVIAEDCPDPTADPVILQIILLNLINNAVEAIQRREPPDQQLGRSFRPSRIIVTMESSAKDPSFVSLSVSDNGIGLQDHSPAELLSPFFKSGTTGLGMGLAIVQTFVEQQNGHVYITANQEEGITVTILLPKYHSPESDRMAATTADSTQFTDALKST